MQETKVIKETEKKEEIEIIYTSSTPEPNEEIEIAANYDNIIVLSVVAVILIGIAILFIGVIYKFKK